MNRLVALDLPGGQRFVEALVDAWEDGDAVLPLDRRLPLAARRLLAENMQAAVVVDETGSTRLDGERPVESGDALVVPTSGSTGAPKGVVLTIDAVKASAEATSARLGIDPRADVWLACLPLSHVGGLSVVTRSLVTGTELVVHDGFDATAVERAARQGVTAVSLVTTALQRVDPSLFRVILLGGSAIPADRPANSVATYGMTESGSGVVYDGVPLEGVEVRVVDAELQLRCPMLLRCYRDGTDPKTSDGWYPTGDLGTFDDGVVSVHGRAGDLIITGGENVFPEPIERCLAEHPAIDDAAVLGLDDAEWGQRVVALIACSHDMPDLDAIRDHVKASLPPWCAPREAHRVASIPRTALGKVARASLADLVPGTNR